MSSALRFMVASVILALSGTVLLVGILATPEEVGVVPAAVTESPSPTTTEALLTGMVTDEVEPGVFRIFHDGVRDLPSSPRNSERYEVVAGHDGSIWILLHGTFYRLGSDEVYEWPKPGTALEVAPNGTIWTAKTEGRNAALHSFDGETWKAYDGVPRGLEISPSGTVWVDMMHPGEPVSRSSVIYSNDDGANWQTLEAPASLVPTVANDSDIGVAGGDDGGLDAFWHYLDGTWSRSDYYLAADRPQAPQASSSGTYWFWGTDDGSGNKETVLVRFDGSEWQEWSPPEMAEVGLYPNVWALDRFAVAPDGSLWSDMAGTSAEAAAGTYCAGVSRFDGETLQRYLKSACIDGMDIAADGSVWVTTEQGLYVITPKAVTTTA